VEWCFKKAEEYFPNNELVINEWTGACWGREKWYYDYIQKNLKNGARIDAIGCQCHFFHPLEKEYEATRDLLDPKHLYERMDLFASLGKPLQITEITFPAYSWGQEDEEIQAKMLEYMYKVWFSHESVEQIVYWNLVDGYAHVWESDLDKIAASQGNMSLGENYYYGGLLRFDLSEKPAFKKLKELTQKVWHTEESLQTNEKGETQFRGFYGEYQVEICANGQIYTKTISLCKKQENEFEIKL
jgi:GH35 family endo-1,4-beta-xylanase